MILEIELAGRGPQAVPNGCRFGELVPSYGDIRPNISVLRSLAILEGISGQLFLTLLVARFVGLHIITSHRRFD
jgi:hypothetical protein